MTPREAEMWMATATDDEMRSVLNARNIESGRACKPDAYRAAMNAACEMQVVCCIWPNDLDAALRPKGLARVARMVRLRWRRLTRSLTN